MKLFPAQFIQRALLCLALLGTAPLALANSNLNPPPKQVTQTIENAKLMGYGTLRWFGLRVYDGQLWSNTDPEGFNYKRDPAWLELKYARDFEGSDIAERAPFSWQPEQGATHIEQDGALQSALRIGRPLFNKTHPDFCAFSVLNTILGDYFGSRLMSNIREDKGYTYGIGSHIVENNNFGYFVIGTEVGVQTRTATFIEIQKEFERLQTEPVPDEELELVKSYLMGQLLKSADGPYAMLDLFANVETMGLDLSFYDRYIAEIKAVDAQKLQELAQRYLNWDEMLIISAG